MFASHTLPLSSVLSFAVMTLAVSALGGCTNDSEESTPETPDEVEVRALAEPLRASPGCEAFEALSRPAAVVHFQDPNLKQTVGRFALRTEHDGWPSARGGIALATIVGSEPNGSLLGNHHFVLGDGAIRTHNDTIDMTPTGDPCVFDVTSNLFIADGSGRYAGVTGTARAKGQVNFCGPPGRVYIWGELCR